MAKKGKRTSNKRSGEKSLAVRTFLQTDPSAGPAIVVSTLKEQGIDVSAQLVSNIRAKMKKEGQISGGTARAGRPKKGTKSGAKSGTNRGSLAGNYSSLREAKKLVLSAGSVQAAREALDVLEELRS